MRFKTQGGGVVTWTPTPDERKPGFPTLDHYGHLMCSGCGTDVRLTHEHQANGHAQKCHAIP